MGTTPEMVFSIKENLTDQPGTLVPQPVTIAPTSTPKSILVSDHLRSVQTQLSTTTTVVNSTVGSILTSQLFQPTTVLPTQALSAMDSTPVLKLADFTDEINAFEKELHQLKYSFPDCSKCVGSEEELEWVKKQTEILMNDFGILMNDEQQLNANVEDLKSMCRETITELGQAQSQKIRSDLNHQKTLQNWPLLPKQAKQMQHLKTLEQQVCSDLEEIFQSQNQVWMQCFNLPQDLQESVTTLTTATFEISNSSAKNDDSGAKDEKHLVDCGSVAYEKEKITVQSTDVTVPQSCLEQAPACVTSVARKHKTSNFKAVEEHPPYKDKSSFKENKISALRQFQSKYKNVLQETNSFEIIKEYRLDIDDITEKCITNLENQLETVLDNSSKVQNRNKAVLERYANIIIEQQKTFQQYVCGVKSQFSDMFSEPVMSVVDRCEQLFEEIKLECALLSKFCPLYAYKNNVISLIENNQVSIILADAVYSTTETLLVFIRKYLKRNKAIAVCEPNIAKVNYMLDRFLKLNNVAGKGIYSLISRICAEKTELVFLTVDELYDVFLTDSSFASYSFVIVDCALKRSIQADLLLNALRECCRKRMDLKVILVISPPQSPAKFEHYFSSAVSTGSFFTPNLIYPVQKVWKRSDSRQHKYIQEASETVLAIHATKQSGDVLVFLPTHDDIAKVVVDLQAKFQQYSYIDVECVPLMEDKINDLSLTTPEHLGISKRKIILGTSFAEHLLFPTVAFVVDSGLSMDCEYDYGKCFEVQKLNLITRERAKLRKSCAGRYRAGVCFRLYSKRNYAHDMVAHEHSEVIRKNPYETMLRIYQCKSASSIEVELIEPLSKDVAEKAVAKLEAANAINNCQLTSLGKSVIMLPFSPKYSKMIVLGIQWGFSFESILLVSFFMVKRSVFVQDIDVKEQNSLALRKLQFLCQDSDTFTFLNIYSSWMQNNFSENWCRQNLLDFHTLNEVKVKVSEITDVVAWRMKQNIVPMLNVEKHTDWSALQEIVFDCLRENFCVYSGHSKSGYHVHDSGSIAYLDPSSPVVHKGNLPQFVVFNDLIGSSRNFMSYITAVPEEIVFSAIDKGVLPAKMRELFNAKLEPYLIEPVGFALIKQLFQSDKSTQLPSIEEKVKARLDSNMVVLEPSEDKGSITVYALPEKWPECEKIIRKILDQENENIIFEKDDRLVNLKKGRSSVVVCITWTKGASIIKIEPSYKNCISSHATVRSTAFDDEHISAVKKSINLLWPRRFCTGTAYISFDSMGFKLARRLSLTSIKFGEEEANITISDSSENQLIITGLTPTVDAKDLKTAIEAQLPKDISVKEVSLLLEKPFPTTDEDLQQVTETLDEYCCVLISENLVADYKVLVPKPVDRAPKMEATVKVDPQTSLEELAARMNKELTISELQVKAVPYFSCTFTCSLPIFNAVEGLLTDQLDVVENVLKTNKTFLSNNLFDFKVDVDHDTAVMVFSSSAEYVMNYLYKVIHEILDGVTLDSSKMPELHRLFTHGGHLWLRALEKQEDVYVVEEYKCKKLRIYGQPQACTNATKRIEKFIIDTLDELVTVIDLSSGRYNNALFKAIIDKYGFSLNSLVEEFNLHSADIDIRTSKLKLHGSPDAVEDAVAGLEKLDTDLLELKKEKQESLPFQELCSVCHMPPRQLSIRLEHCSHLYCAECMQGLIKCAKFPILCCAENCNKELILEDIRKGLDYDEEALDWLTTQALNDYLSHNVLQYMYCPAPDCPMFCDKSKVSGEKWHCPLCQNDICLNCNVIYHMGYTCDLYQGSKDDADYSYKVWVRDYKPDCKVCPQCKHAIERSAGCNHMHCTYCNSHFCWLCGTQFGSDNAVYDHAPYCLRNQGRN